MNYDVIIAGAGSMGMATGYFLAKQGKKVLMIDAYDPPHIQGAHHGLTKVIRHVHVREQYISLALKSQQLWEELENQWDKPLFHKTGILNADVATSTSIQNLIDIASIHNITMETMTPVDVKSRWKGFSLPPNYTALFEPNAGILRGEECLRAYRQLFFNLGGKLITNTPIIDIDIQADSVSVKTKDETYHGASLVLSSGHNLLKMAGLTFPLTVFRKATAWFYANHLYHSDSFPAYHINTEDGRFFGFPNIAGGKGLKAGRYDGGQILEEGAYVKEFGEYEEDIPEITDFTYKYLPFVSSLQDGAVYTTSKTPDNNFIIDLHPEFSHVAVATAFSGYGFQFASVIGEILGELIMNKQTQYDISLFSAKRF